MLALLAVIMISSSLTSPCRSSHHLLSYGDSKTVQFPGGSNADSFQTHMERAYGSCGPRFDIGSPTHPNGALARASHTVAMMKALIDADLATIPASPAPTAILVNLGSAELALGVPAEAGWLADYGYILDAMHVKWPTATIYCHRPWRQGSDSDANTIAGRIATVISTRSSFAVSGPDERTWAKGTDDGVTMMKDGLHYSLAGAVECASQWRAILGL